jgi:hypothetical protein
VKKKYKIILGILALLIVIRLILPYIILHYANKTLANNIHGYYGHIDDIDLSIYRGAYIINAIYLNKVDSVSKKQTEFFKSSAIDLSIEWRALFHGSIVGKLILDSPVLIFTKDKTELSDVKKDTTDFRKTLKNFMPLKVNRFEINNGSIHYVDNTSKPKVDVSINRAHILALNLTNAADDKILLPSTVTAQASVYEGSLDFNMKLNALAESPIFELNAEIKNTNLALLNDFLKAYGDFDVNRGKFSLYSEVAARDGKFIGYVKPFIKDLKVIGPQDKNDSFLQKVWEHIIGAAGVVLKNQHKEQIATKVSIEGHFNSPKTNIMEAVWEVLRNAFVQALIPNIDHEININSVNSVKPEDKRSFLKKIFSSDKKNKGK